MNERLDLSRHRELGDLIGGTVRLFLNHLAVFLSVTLLIVTPVVLIVDGIWGRALADGVEPPEFRELLYYLVDTVLEKAPPPDDGPKEFAVELGLPSRSPVVA